MAGIHLMGLSSEVVDSKSNQPLEGDNDHDMHWFFFLIFCDCRLNSIVNTWLDIKIKGTSNPADGAVFPQCQMPWCSSSALLLLFSNLGWEM